MSAAKFLRMNGMAYPVWTTSKQASYILLAHSFWVAQLRSWHILVSPKVAHDGKYHGYMTLATTMPRGLLFCHSFSVEVVGEAFPRLFPLFSFFFYLSSQILGLSFINDVKGSIRSHPGSSICHAPPEHDGSKLILPQLWGNGFSNASAFGLLHTWRVIGN